MPNTASNPALENWPQAMATLVRVSRERQQLSLRALATQADIGLQTLVRIEDGSPGVSLHNIEKVLAALGEPAPDFMSLSRTDEESSLHALHRDSAQVQAGIEEAARAACEVLNALLPTKTPERDGVGDTFMAQLMGHLGAMLCGQAAARERRHLKRLVYSDADVGGPTRTPEGAAGWALVLRKSGKALQDGQALSIADDAFSPWASRGDALVDFQAHVERYGHLPDEVNAIPVWFDDARERYVSRAPNPAG